MSKRERHLRQRLEELFSSEPTPEAETPLGESPAVHTAADTSTLPAHSIAADVKTVIEQMPVPVYIKDREHNWVAVNAAFSQRLGQPASALIGHVDKEQADEEWQLDDRVLESGAVDEEQQTTTLPDGSIHVVRTRRVPLFNAEHQIAGLMGIIHETNLLNISENKQAEARLHLLQTAVEAAANGIAIIDRSGTVQWINPAFTELAQYIPTEMIGGNPRILKSGRQDAAFYQHMWQTVLAGEVWQGELVNRRKDGSEYAEEMTITPVRAADGEITHFIAVKRDVTERKLAEAERERIFESEAKRALRLKAGAEIAKAIATILDLDQLLPVVVDLIRERFALYYVGLFLVDEPRQSARLRAGTGEAGRQMLSANHRLEIGDSSMIGWCIYHQQARIALDVGADAVRFDNPLLPETRSEVALPLISRGQVLGAMTAQSSEVAAFTEQDVAVLQSMADQVANAIANAQLFEQSRMARSEAETRLREVQFLQRVSQASSETLDPEQVYDVVFEALEQELGFTHIALVIFDKAQGRALTVRAVGTARELQGLDRRMADLENDIVMQIALGGKIEVVDGWDDRFDREIFESQGHDKLVRAFVPLLLRDESIGLLEVGYQRAERAHITDNEVRLLGSLADQIAVAIANAQLFDETERRVTEMSILNEISRAFSMSQSSEQFFKTVHEQVARLFDTRNFFIITYEGGAEWASAYHIENGVRQPSAVYALGRGFTSHILRTREPILIHSRAENLTFHDQHGLQLVGKTAVSWMGVPLMVSGQPLGVMGIQDYERENLYHDHDLVLFSTIAAQAAITLQNTHLFEEAQLRAKELAALNELSRTLAIRLNMGQVLEEIHRGVARLLDATNFFVALYDADRDAVSFPIDTSQSTLDQEIVSMPADQGLTGYVIRNRTSLLIKEDVRGWEKRMGLEPKGDAAESWLGVPMLLGNQVLGVIATQSYTTARAYDEHDRDVLTAIAGQAAIAVQNARLFEQIQKQASELAVFNEIIYELSQSVELSRVLEVAYQHIQQLIPLDAFIVAMYDATTHKVLYPLIYDEGQRYEPTSGPLRRDSLAGDVILTGQPRLINRSPEELAALSAGAAERSALGNVARIAASLLYVPLKYEQRTIGAISAQSYQLNAYNSKHLNLLTRLANQLTVAVQNARLLEQTQSNARELAALNEIARSIAQQTEVAQMLEATYRQLQQLLPVDAFIVGLYDEPSQTVSFPIVYDEGRRFPDFAGPLNPTSGIGRTILSGQVELALPTAEELAHMTSVSNAVGNVGKPSASLLYIPLQVGQRTIGALSVQSYQLNAYTEDHVRLMGAVASQLAIAVQNAQSYEQTRRAARREQALREITARVRGSVDPEAIARTAVKDLGEVLNRSTFIRLGSAEQLASSAILATAEADKPPRHSDGDGSIPQGGK